MIFFNLLHAFIRPVDIGQANLKHAEAVVLPVCVNGAVVIHMQINVIMRRIL